MTIADKQKSGCLGLLFPFLKPGQPKSGPVELPYRLRDEFLSAAEISFYKILVSIAGAQFTIQSKVRLADLFYVARPNENQSARNRIAQKHIDFVLCETTTMKPVCGIELDDSSHQRTDRQERDEFVEAACRAAGFPLFRFPAQRASNTNEIAAQLAKFIKA